MKVITLRIVNRLKLIPYDVGLILGILLLSGGFGLVAWQIFLWLDEKIWHSYSLYTLLEYWLRSLPPEVILRNPGLLWFFQPNRLLGLHALLIWILDFIPISLLLIIGGGFLVMGALNQRYIVKERNEYDLAKSLGLDDPTLIKAPDGILNHFQCSGRLLYETNYHLRFYVNRITKDSLVSDMKIDIEGEPYGKFAKNFEVTLPRIRDIVFQLSPSFEIKGKLFPSLFVVCIGLSLYAIGPLKAGREKEWELSEKPEAF